MTYSCKIKAIAIIVALLLPCFCQAQETQVRQKVLVEYFFQAGCRECELIRNFVLPKIEERFPGYYELKKIDIANKENFLKLAEYQESLSIKGNEPVTMVVNSKIALSGYKEIESKLIETIDTCISELSSQDIPSSFSKIKPISMPDENELLKKRASKMLPAAIITAGLIDGINPCVFSTLVFFVSLLSVSKVNGRKLLLAGGFYCISCFLTYLLLGLGIFEFLKLFHENILFRSVLNWSMFGLLMVFALISFHDAWLFRKTGAPSSVWLQLPDSLKNRIHGIMHRGLAYRFLIPGALFIGFAVTIIESVCTGQVYVPTLALLIKQYGDSWKWLSYLVLYNVMFIVPLLVIFAASYYGATTSMLLRWTKNDVVVGKMAMGIFFLLLGLLMIFL